MNINYNPQEIFKERFKQVPSILSIRMNNVSQDVIDKFVSKSHLIFTEKIVEYGKIKEFKKLVEYDPNGILIYIEDSVNIFILTTTDRLNVAEFTLHNLIKLNK
jgi:hypothetical protein